MSKVKLNINELEIVLFKQNEEEYISLTDMAKFRDSKRSDYIIQNWMRTKNTIEFLGLWEQLNNPDFNSIEFDGFRNESGSNSFTLTPKKWIRATNSVGIISKSGRYGGTYAHKDIAFEFASWLSPTFKLYLITEYQRLKEIETNQYNLEWNVKRILSKTNYHIHTDAVKNYILPNKNYEKDKEWIAYAETLEAKSQWNSVKTSVSSVVKEKEINHGESQRIHREAQRRGIKNYEKRKSQSRFAFCHLDKGEISFKLSCSENHEIPHCVRNDRSSKLTAQSS